MSLADDLLKQFEHVIESVTLVPADEGKFEVSLNGKLVFSKLQTGRHASAGEIAGLVEKLIEG